MGDVQATAGGRSSSVSRGCRPVSSVASLSSSRHPRPRAEGPRLLHVACPWMLGSSPSLTIERRRHDGKGCAYRRPSTLFSGGRVRSEEHPSELQSLMRNPYAVFCLKKKTSKLGRSCVRRIMVSI